MAAIWRLLRWLSTWAAPQASSLGSIGRAFRPGWEDIFRMNQKQLEVRFLSSTMFVYRATG